MNSESHADDHLRLYAVLRRYEVDRNGDAYVEQQESSVHVSAALLDFSGEVAAVENYTDTVD